jgi:hypothetical protein
MIDKKLQKAASTIRDTYPDYSEEIMRIAQDLSNDSNTNLAVNNLNPNIDPKYIQTTKSEAPKEVHKITFTVEVPANFDELKIMNALLPVTKQMEDSGISLKGYQFNER